MFTDGSRYIVITVAWERSVLKKSCCTNFTRSATPAWRAFSSLSADEVRVDVHAEPARAELAAPP